MKNEKEIRQIIEYIDFELEAEKAKKIVGQGDLENVKKLMDKRFLLMFILGDVK